MTSYSNRHIIYGKLFYINIHTTTEGWRSVDLKPEKLKQITIIITILTDRSWAHVILNTVIFFLPTGLDESDSLRYTIHSDEANRYFSIDPTRGVIRTTAVLDHESFESVLLNVKAYSATDSYYGAHTQVSVVTCK